MRIYQFILLFLLAPVICAAQFTVQGTVINAADNKPIPDASVFLNNATVGTKAGTDGAFTLYNVGAGQYDLIVSVVGFETYKQTITANKSLKLPPIKMMPKTNSLKVVKIGDDPKWNRKLRLFREYFLGTSPFGKQCVVLNPEALFLRFSKSEQLLSGMTEDFLEIDNKALGYKLKYLLDKFTLDREAMKLAYEGSVLYEESAGSAEQIEKWRANRRKVYYGSAKHFLRELVGNHADQDFMVRAFCIRKIDTNKAVITEPGQLLYDKRLKYDTLKTADYVHPTDQRFIFALSYKEGMDVFYYKPGTRHRLTDTGGERGNRGQVAGITFLDDNLFFDTNGTILNPDAALFTYSWAVTRVGDQLPVDYVPDQPDR